MQSQPTYPKPYRFRQPNSRKFINKLLFFLIPVLLVTVNTSGAGAQSGATGTVSGTLTKWHPITVDFAGPTASETDDNPNPFLDYRLQVTFTGPGGQSTTVPGFFDGDGNGGGQGNVWRARFSPDAAGQWSYVASFRQGNNVAIDLSPSAGSATGFDGASGTFTVADRDPNAPGFLKWGRLEYVNQHYLKFRDGPYWIKGGVDSPENFMGYAGFDNTVNQSGGAGDGGLQDGLHRYPSHAGDWQSGDPNFSSADTGYDGKAIIGALNYLSSQNVNSIYFLPMNLGGDGRETYPFVGPSGSDFDNTHYDISKLSQWNQVFNHAQQRGVALHFVLAETESGNENWFDNGNLGVERKLYYRELAARFGHVLAAKWNLSEENDFSISNLRAFAGYIQAVDAYDHPIAVHTHTNNFSDYEQIKGDSRFSATSIQYGPDKANNHVETWRANSAAAGRPWVLDMDENSPASTGLTDSNATDLRKRVLYDVYFSGGNIEWYFGYHSLPLGGDMRTEDFRTREEMYDYMWYARRFMQEHLPFWEMEPADDLLTGEPSDFGGGQVFAKAGQVYAIYLPKANPAGSLDLSGVTGNFEQRWYNPRSGSFAGETTIVSGGGSVDLGAAPANGLQDWVILLESTSASPTATPTLEPGVTPTSTPTATNTPPADQSVTSFYLVNADTDEDIGLLKNGDTLDLAELPTAKLNIRAETNPTTVGSVKFELTGRADAIENVPPYALAGDRGGDYNAWTPAEGQYTLTATPYDGSSADGTAGAGLTVNFTVTSGSGSTATPTATATATNTVPPATNTPTATNTAAPTNTPPPTATATTLPPSPTPAADQAVVSFTLIDAATDQELGELADGASINLATTSGKLNIRANTAPAVVGSVKFLRNGAHVRTENVEPYAMAGNRGSNYYEWAPDVGSYVLEAIPYSGGNAQGAAGASLTVSFTVVNESSPPTPAATETSTATPTSTSPPATATHTPQPPTATPTATATTPPTSTPEPIEGQAVSSFTLVDAETNQDIRPLADGDILDLSSLPTRKLNIRANTEPLEVGSVRFGLDGNANYRTENVPPYALAGDTDADYRAWTPDVGQHTLTATPYSESSGQGIPGDGLAITFEVVDASAQAVVDLMLVNADTGQPIGPLVDGGTIDLESLPTRNINIRAMTNPEPVGSVRFDLNGRKFRTENVAPYALAGDADGDYSVWQPEVGRHVLSAVPFSEFSASGDAGQTLTVNFMITE